MLRRDNKVNNSLLKTRMATSLRAWQQYKRARIKGKGKGHTLDIEPLSKETSLQKRSGMARVVEGFHSFTYTPTHLSMNGMNHTCLCLPSRSWSSFTDPGGMEG